MGWFNIKKLNMNIKDLQKFLGTLVVSLDDTGIELITDICLYSINNKLSGYGLTPAYTDISIECRFKGDRMDITIVQGNESWSFRYIYELDLLSVLVISTKVVGNYSTSDPLIECRPS